jgi:hypothetical protein
MMLNSVSNLRRTHGKINILQTMATLPALQMIAGILPALMSAGF